MIMLNDLINIEEENLLLPQYRGYINTLLKFRQFSESFLIKSNQYYDGTECLKWQKNLSPEFCFRYLYDKDDGDQWVDFNAVVKYINKYYPNLSKDDIDNIFNLVINSK
jgi:hypothetical protein